MDRRSFVKYSSLAALPLKLNGLSLGAFSNSFVANRLNNKVLVIIQMNGGNDGLNTIVPLSQYDKLQAHRANILIEENKLLETNDGLHFHPSLSRLVNLYNEDKVKIINSVGYPNHNRSHFRSQDIWFTASDSNELLTEGWLGSYFDLFTENFPSAYPSFDYPHPFGVTLGTTVTETCEGLVGNYSVALKDPATAFDVDLNCLPEYESEQIREEINFIRTSYNQTKKYLQSINQAYAQGQNTGEYEEDKLSEQLKTVARLIAGGLESKVYVVNIGSFDNHISQTTNNDTSIGKHAELLESLSNAISSFQADIEQQSLDDRVLGMCFSEFGRQIKSNQQNGTDHGTAGPVILFGSCINNTTEGTEVHIPEAVEEQDGIPIQFDFRSIYKSILQQWFAASDEVANVLGYDQFNMISISDCEIVTPPVCTDIDLTSGVDSKNINNAVTLFPNPCKNFINISLNGVVGRFKIDIYNLLGERCSLLEYNFRKSNDTPQIDVSHLSAGNYFIRLYNKHFSLSSAFVKI